MLESTAYLSLGANLGDGRATIADTIGRLSAAGARVVARSSDYVTPPWGKLDQPDFVNACVKLSTKLTPLDLLRLCLATETALGRARTEKWGPRTIDIDVLIYDNETINTTELKLPHPHMLERAFVLVPLLEIAPDLVIADRPIAAWIATLDVKNIRRLSS
jgi:2-amino-4-hydroxy-6-hydroxymethyldihydropteridine diphosphokinase